MCIRDSIRRLEKRLAHDGKELAMILRRVGVEADVLSPGFGLLDTAAEIVVTRDQHPLPVGTRDFRR